MASFSTSLRPVTPTSRSIGMRIAVIADIHGNLPALEAVRIDIARRHVDRTINLGDCVSDPLWPREVAICSWPLTT